VSSAVAVVGLGLVGLGPSEVGAALTLVGTVGLMASVHRYGRLGPDGERLAR
jgi:hypothetical protein